MAVVIGGHFRVIWGRRREGFVLVLIVGGCARELEGVRRDEVWGAEVVARRRLRLGAEGGLLFQPREDGFEIGIGVSGDIVGEKAIFLVGGGWRDGGEGDGEGFGGLEALVFFFGEAEGDDVLEPLGEGGFGAGELDGEGIFLEMAAEGHGRRRSEGGFAGQEVVEQGAHGVDIAGRAWLMTLDGFRREIVGEASEEGRVVADDFVGRGGQEDAPQGGVGDAQDAFPVGGAFDEEGLWGQGAVHEVELVEGVEGVEELPGDGDGSLLREALVFLQEVREGVSFDPLLKDEDEAVVGAFRMRDAGDGGVLDGSQRFEISEQALRPRWVDAAVGVKHAEGEGAFVLGDAKEGSQGILLQSSFQAIADDVVTFVEGEVGDLGQLMAVERAETNVVLEGREAKWAGSQLGLREE